MGFSIKNLFVKYKILTLLVATLVIWLFFNFFNDGDYLTARNLSNLFRQMAITGVLACGMVFVIISGEIDLSVGSLLGCLGGIGAICNVWFGLSAPITILIVIALGILVGIFNGYWVANRRIPSFIVTLAGMLVFRGLLLGFTKGQTVAPISDDLAWIGSGYIGGSTSYIIGIVVICLYIFSSFSQRSNKLKYGMVVSNIGIEIIKYIAISFIVLSAVYTLNLYHGIPVPVLIIIILLIVLTFISKKTVLGRRIYSVGGNMEATRMSGINVNLVKIYVFVIMGIMAAIAGILTTSRLGAGSPSAGNMGELDAIASCFIGGTSMKGGVGTVSGVLVGALIMASLDNGMSMMGLDSFWQMIVKGSVLLIAVWLDVISTGGGAVKK